MLGEERKKKGSHMMNLQVEKSQNEENTVRIPKYNQYWRHRGIYQEKENPGTM